MRWTKKKILQRAVELGLDVKTHAPGDGVRRYVFQIDGVCFGFHCMGVAKAANFLQGFQCGLEAAICRMEKYLTKESRGLS